MKRILAILAVLAAAFTLSLATPIVAQDAKPAAKKAVAKKAAAKKPVPKKAAKAAPATAKKGQKVCRTKLPSGQTKTWTCRTDQPCCESHALGLYTCGSQLLQCF